MNTAGWRLAWLVLPASAALLAGAARGQNVIQLPEFNFFTVNTTVSVPDRGGVLLGGIKSARDGAITSGVPGLGKIPGASRLFNNRGIGSEREAGLASVHATIIDHREYDEALLAEAAARRGAPSPAALELAAKAEFLSRHVARAAVEPAAAPDARFASQGSLSASVEELRGRAAAAQAERAREAEGYYARANAMVAEGKPGAAKVYYQMALTRAEGAFRGEIEARLTALKNGAAVKLVARE